MNFNIFSIYNSCSYDDCNNACILAKSIEESGGEYDRGYVYSLYQKASIKHIPYAERRLGALTIDGIGTKKDFMKGLGYYLLAATDGDSYSKVMFLGLQECGNANFTLSESDIDNALSGIPYAIVKLGAAFILYGANYNRVIELCIDGANNGVLQCIFSILDALYDIDNIEFQRNPLQRELFQQDEQWKSIASQYVSNQNIFNEVLVVNSKKRYYQIFEILKYIFLNYSNNDDFIKNAIVTYYQIVTETNSFNRDTELYQEISNTNDVNNFDNWIYSKVSQMVTLQRGMELFQNCNVIDINSYENKLYANVIGSTGLVYCVQFTIDNHNIRDVSCNCQAFSKYDGLCKHIIATLFACKTNICGEVTYRNTFFPEYSASVGGKLFKYINNVFIYVYKEKELESYINKLISIDDIIFLPVVGRDYDYGKYQRTTYAERNNNYRADIFYPKTDDGNKVIIHLQKEINGSVDENESRNVREFVRSL